MQQPTQQDTFLKEIVSQYLIPPWVPFSRVDGVYQLNQLVKDDLLQLEESGDVHAHDLKATLEAVLHGLGGRHVYVNIRMDPMSEQLRFHLKFIRPTERFPYVFSRPLNNPSSEISSYNIKVLEVSSHLLTSIKLAVWQPQWHKILAKDNTDADEMFAFNIYQLNEMAHDDPLELEESGDVHVRGSKYRDLPTREAILHGHVGHGGQHEYVDISSSPLQGAIMKEGEGSAEPEHVDSSAKALSAKRVEMPSFNDSLPVRKRRRFVAVYRDTKSDVQSSISKETQLPSKSIFLTPCSSSIGSPIDPIDKGENTNGILRLLRMENTCSGETIFVGVVVHETPSEFLEFFFFNATDMLRCVGVGLSQARVILDNDLSVSVRETTVSERELECTWRRFLSDKSCHLVMKVEMEATLSMQGNRDDHMQTFATEEGETLSRCGVGFNRSPQYVDETYDAAVVSWPRLYDMALFILTTNNGERNGNSSGQRSGSFQGNVQNNIEDKLRGKQDSVINGGNRQGGDRGDGDGVNYNGNHNVSEDDELPPIVLKVTVYPSPNDDIIGTPMKPPKLKSAFIAPKLVFEFRQNSSKNRISIKAQTHLELVSEKKVFRDTNLFGWYHDEIRISFGCKHIEAGRLDPGSYGISNPKIPNKYTAAKSRISTEATTCTVGGQAGITVFGNGFQASSSGSRMNQEATSAGENIEMPGECICEGFSFKDDSSLARASFLLSYPLKYLSIWDDREFLHRQGLTSTIVPSIQGTWIPINKHIAAHYSFKVERWLKLHERADGPNDRVSVYRQKYVLPFFVNHAMTHLRNQPIVLELHGNQQSIPDVLMVASVNNMIRA